PQLGASQPQDLSQPQPQLGSLQQLASQQPQPLPQPQPWKQLQRRSRMQQPPPQPQQLLQQLLQPQLGSLQQPGSAQQDFSQQPQLGSEQQPQPPPSIRSSKQHAPKLGLTRATLTMIAPKKFPFIEHRLLFFGTHRAIRFADFQQRAMPPHAVPLAGRRDACLATPNNSD